MAHERNWRTHPCAQQDALLGALQKVGIVQNIVVNARTGKMLDGHLRVEMANASFSFMPFPRGPGLLR